MSAEENKMSIQHWVEVAWNGGNLSVADEVYSVDYLLHDPAGPIHGTEALKQFVSTFQTAYPDLHTTIEDMIAEGNKVVWRYTVRGTHRGEFMGIAPTGKSITLTGI